jgi:DNA-binding response OmpR family regulator
VQRKILVVEDEASIRNLIYILLGALKWDGDVACSGRQALSMIARESFDAVLLDIRSSELPPDQVVREICEIRPSLVGRILFVTGEVSDPETMNLIERNCAASVRRGHLMHDLWDRLRVLLGPAEAAPITR